MLLHDQLDGELIKRRAAIASGRKCDYVGCVVAAVVIAAAALEDLGSGDYRVERYMREAKVMQIFEGTNQIQRLVIARSLTVK